MHIVLPPVTDKIKSTDGTDYQLQLLQIAPWNMDITDSLSITHGLGSKYSDVIILGGMIRSDNGNAWYPPYRARSAGGELQWSIAAINSTVIQVLRTVGGDFDSPDFSSTAFNRGYIVLLVPTS